MTRPSLLFVDDDELLCRAIVKILRPLAVEVVTCGSGADAIELLRGRRFTALITDHALIGMSGLEVIDAARALQPDLVAGLIGGQLTADLMQRAVNYHHVRIVLRKPWSTEELRYVVGAACLVGGESQQGE